MATKHKYVHKEKRKWTYGAELELADWPRNETLPEGMQVDHGAYTNVNSNGVAADGPGKLFHLGGEILTMPSTRKSGPADQFQEIIKRWPQTSLNYRMGLNVHVRIPGLKDDLDRLRQIQSFTHKVMPELLSVIDPIPKADPDVPGSRKCYVTRRKDHHTLLPGWRIELQSKAKTPKEFFESEVIHLTTGKLYWAINPRICVNLRQILQTDTIEFRHFFMPRTTAELWNATDWCHFFLKNALEGENVTPERMLKEFGFRQRAWPKAMGYDCWLDKGWHHTTVHKNKKEDVPRLIEEWLGQNPKPKGKTICLGS